MVVALETIQEILTEDALFAWLSLHTIEGMADVYAFLVEGLQALAPRLLPFGWRHLTGLLLMLVFLLRGQIRQGRASFANDRCQLGIGHAKAVIFMGKFCYLVLELRHGIT